MADAAPFGVVRAVVCEDEPLARKAMQEYLRDVEWIEVVAYASNGSEALRFINKHDPDLVFLDVRMPGMSGIEVLDALEQKPAVVFTTAFDEYAISAFEHGAVDYLVKPFGRDRLIQTLTRVRVRLVGEARAQRVSLSSGAGDAPSRAMEGGRGDGPRPDSGATFAERLFARHRRGIVPVSVNDIRRVEAVDGGVEIHAGDRTLELDSSLGEVESRLDPKDFVRVHRAHLVNLGRVRSIRRYDERRLIITLDDDSTIVASRTGSQSLRGLME
jgi:two-component system, LytTR family, response regulator